MELACIKKHLDQQSISIVPMPQVSYLDMTNKEIKWYVQFLAENLAFKMCSCLKRNFACHVACEFKNDSGSGG